jgi:hypothetical protein
LIRAVETNELADQVEVLDRIADLACRAAGRDSASRIN